MDDDTRYRFASDLANNKFRHNADSLLRTAKEHTDKNLRHFITDGLPAYMKSRRKVFDPETNPVRHIHLREGMNNNKMERLNGTIHDCEKTFRSLSNMDTFVFESMKVHYKHVGKHD
ncbi:MAG: hypothetical protein OXP12_07885 [Thaumarchaeota archaeon]|nr:hypothetical protein [Nitrososphaerota archaeon]MDE0265759.1 hypothetical protein [Nitrososphaerota archaeon]MDE0525111.1 hypothetical protein [Nitrososphaerota archaeon]